MLLAFFVDILSFCYFLNFLLTHVQNLCVQSLCIYYYMYPGQKIETGTQAKHRRVHARQITRLCHAAHAHDCLNFFGQGGRLYFLKMCSVCVLGVPNKHHDHESKNCHLQVLFIFSFGNMRAAWRHLGANNFHAICHLAPCLSPPSIAEGLSAQRQAVRQYRSSSSRGQIGSKNLFLRS